MIKLQVKVTKEILRESMYCGMDGKLPNSNCAVALAVRQIFPKASVGSVGYLPFGYIGNQIKHDGSEFISLFDSLKSTPEKRLSIPETTVTLDITDEILERINLEDMSNMVSKIEHLELIVK